MARRWKYRPEGSNWGEFGDDDQLGSLNYIAPDAVLRAIGEVRSGLSFCLSLPLDYPGGRKLAAHRAPPILRTVERKGKPYFNHSFHEEGGYCDVGSDDYVTLWTQYSTQWDGLCHIGAAFDIHGSGQPTPCYYNGYVAGQEIVPPEYRPDGADTPLGIDRFAVKAIQTRGVLIDIDRYYGRLCQTIGFRELQDVIRQDRVDIQPGDIVCLHTGYADEVLKMRRDPDETALHGICAALDGSDLRLHDWLSECRIAALVADNYAVERIDPKRKGAPHLLPLHHHCLFKRGMPLGELWHLGELAAWLRAHGRTSFLLTAPPLRLAGAVGSPVTPVATV